MYACLKKFSTKTINRRSFSSRAFDEWNPRMRTLAQKYPRLYDKESFLNEQNEFLESQQDSISKYAEDYENGKELVNNMIGDELFPNISTIIKQYEPIFSNTYFEENSEEFNQKLTNGETLISELLALQQTNVSTIEETNLHMIAVANYADKIDEWRLSLMSDTNKSGINSDTLGFPISDKKLDAWVLNEYYHAPDHVREQGLVTHEEHRKLENQWMREVDERLIIKLKKDASAAGLEFNENAWIEFNLIINDIFHPHNIDHYAFTNASKALFRAAHWQTVNDTSDRASLVEENVIKLKEITDDKRDNECEIVRRCYEMNIDMKYGSLVALQLQVTDPLFAAKLCDEARLIMEKVAFDRAVYDVMRDLEIPNIEAEKIADEEELRETMSSNPTNLLRNIRRLENEAIKYNVEVPDLESVLDSILPIKLWGKEISGVKKAIMAYATGDSTLNDIQLEIIDVLLAEDVIQSIKNDGILDDEEITKFSVDLHNARSSNPEWWNLKDFIVNHCNVKRDRKSIVKNQQILKRKLNSWSIDPLLINLLCIMFADGICNVDSFRLLITNYQTIMRRYRGEVDAVVISAQPLTENIFKSILMALENSNPEKKITLEQLIDVGVQAGFIVKAGLQQFDFSLATHLQQAL